MTGIYWDTLQEEGKQRREKREAIRKMNKPALTKYRAEIRKAWLPLTGLKKLRGRDYRLVERWFNDGIDLKLVLRAIEEVKGRTLTSLGYIVPRIERLKREEGKVGVGGQVPGVGAEENQRQEWRLLLEEMWETTRNPEHAAGIGEPLDKLDELTLEEIQRRVKEL